MGGAAAVGGAWTWVKQYQGYKAEREGKKEGGWDSDYTPVGQVGGQRSRDGNYFIPVQWTAEAETTGTTVWVVQREASERMSVCEKGKQWEKYLMSVCH